jgi:hypothetical protein
MLSKPDGATVFGAAIAEHLEVVRQLAAQQGVLESIALAMTGAKFYGAGTAAARATRNTWQRSWWGASSAIGGGCHRWR